MKNWLIATTLVLLCLGLYLVARYHQRAASSAYGSRPGQFAPELSLKDLNGQELRLVNYRRKVVLLNFWATWCDPCRHEIPEFIQLQNSRHDLQILGISLDDSPEAVRPFYTEFKMNYPVAVGDAALAQRYGGILGLPVTFLIDCDGRIASKHIGEVQIPEVESEINSLLKNPACTR
jgi:peroxiredoxin